MTQVSHPEWRDQNESTTYPFSDAATLTDVEGNVLPTGTFIDAALYPVGGTGVLYLSSISVAQDVATIWIGDTTTEQLCYGEVNLVDPDDMVLLYDVYGRPAGVLVSETLRLAVLQGWTQGVHSFDRDATEFSPRVCFPRPEIGVRGILLDDGSLMTGDVWLVGDDGVVLRTEDVTVGDGCTEDTVSVVRVDIVGDPLYKRRLCSGVNLFETPRFLQSIIVRRDCDDLELLPDEFGNVNILLGTNLAEDTVIRMRNNAGRGILFEAAGDTL